MSNVEFIAKVAYEESIHRSLHGAEHAKPYLDILRKAAALAHVEDAFDNVIFNKYGLAEGGPFVKH